MEFINDYILLSINEREEINHSYCESTSDDSYLHLTFCLCSKDCLFDLDSLNYQVNIRIAKNYLEKYDEPLDIILEKQSICCNTQSKVLEVVNCDLKGIHRKIYLESHILYLLYQSQKNNLIFQLNCDSCTFLNRPLEIDKIQNAKQFILDNLSNNLSIQMIASSVGTNQCYLKKGFKEVVGQTIFEFIQENKMIKAKHLLEKENPNITDIAYLVGYSSLSSFSQAFKNFFGVSPSDQIKQIIPSN